MALAPLPPPSGAEPPATSSGPLVIVAVAVAMLVVLGGLVIAGLIISGNPVASQRRAPVAAAGTDPGVGDTPAGGQGQPISSVQCNTSEQRVRHQHAHLFILKDGSPQPVAAYIGIPGAPLAAHCFYWLHTHDRSGIIHIESPSGHHFSLGEFFDVWGQPLTTTAVARIPVTNGQLAVFVDGNRYSGDPRGIELRGHTEVVIEIGREVPPPIYDLTGY